MHAEFLLAAFENRGGEDAIIWRDQKYSYARLLAEIRALDSELEKHRIPSGSVVTVEGDFSPRAVAAIFALAQRSCVMVPLSPAVGPQREAFRRTACAQYILSLTDNDAVKIEPLENPGNHPLLQTLKANGRPGLVLFSSATTGPAKAILHDFANVLEKHRAQRRGWRCLAFLLLDHVGGMYVLLYALSAGTTLVTIEQRSPESVCRAIEQHRVEFMSVSPTFMNLMLLSEQHRRFDLSSLKVVQYTTERMPDSTLRRFHEVFPDVRLVQSYGASEVGTLRTRSAAPDSTWIELPDDQVQYRVVEGLLELKCSTTMLGYLNAPQPFTPDGWYRTGDAVELNGKLLRILGRQSEMINVGGLKAYPTEIEDVLLQMNGVVEASVMAEENAITGHIVKAVVRLSTGEDRESFSRRMRVFCREKLAAYMVPVRVVVTENPIHNARFKKIRG
jgi:long-chain acyl-CoA synthetase